MTADRAPGARDPGLQSERTRLAWRRTALATTVIMVLMVRLALTGDVVGAVLAGVAVLVWGATLAICWRRGTRAGPGLRYGRSLPLAALATAGYAVLGAVLVVRGLW